MKLSEILAVAWEGLVTNKLRALLTMLGVIIGVAAVIIMMAVSAGTEATIAEQINSLGANLIFVNSGMMRMMPGQAPQGGLVYDDAEAIVQSIPSVVGFAVEQQTSATVEYGNVSLDDITVLGTTPDFPRCATWPGQRPLCQPSDLDHTARVAVLGASVEEQPAARARPAATPRRPHHRGRRKAHRHRRHGPQGHRRRHGLGRARLHAHHRGVQKVPALAL